MFSNVNVMTGREEVGQMSRLHQVGGVLELESTDNWLEVATVSQLEEALDNLCRVWTVMWQPARRHLQAQGLRHDL